MGQPPSGRCSADPALELSADTRVRLCSRGYARIECPRAVAAVEDAFQFLIQAHNEGVFRVAWSAERDHGPVAVGTLEIRETDPAETPLERQARAAIAEYLRRSGRVW